MHKIIICGGGTAGHIYPAMSIIEHLQEHHKEFEILYIGSERGMEKDLIAPLGVGFQAIKAAGLVPSRLLVKKFFSLLRFVAFTVFGFFQAIAALSRFGPDCVLGMGGYVCGPTLLAALMLRKKIYLHEQNYIPGRLNQVFARFAQKVFISFQDSQKYFKVHPGKLLFSGNPVRKVIADYKRKDADYQKWGLEQKRFTVTAFGGSLGAQKINDSVMGLYEIFRHDERLQILLICGNRFYEVFSDDIQKARRADDALIFQVYSYVDAMDEVYALSDLILSRSGANTIAELIRVNIPAILVPFPKAIGDHQYYNAKYLEERGKALIILDRDLNETVISDTISQFMENDQEEYWQIKNRTIDDHRVDSPAMITNTLTGGMIERNR